jgi:hypothetical protein
MSDLDLNKTRQQPKMAVELNFVVNEFPKIRVPKGKQEPEHFQDMNTSKQQMLMQRLIDHVKDL